MYIVLSLIIIYNYLLLTIIYLQGDATILPQNLLSTPLVSLWYKQDTEYNLPKNVMYAEFFRWDYLLFLALYYGDLFLLIVCLLTQPQRGTYYWNQYDEKILNE